MSLLNHLSVANKHSTAVVCQQKKFSYMHLFADVEALSTWFVLNSVKSVCINLPNCYEWLVIDLACQQAEIVCTPIPQFFSHDQTAHLIKQTQPDVIFGETVNSDKSSAVVSPLGIKTYLNLNGAVIKVPRGTSKVTFTSGSTGEPKGVCLSIQNQLQVAKSLVNAIGLRQPKHLVLLPFATLLENIAGVYAPMLANGTVIIPSDNEKGFSGSRLTDVNALLRCISVNQPTSIIIVPELLQVLIFACKQGWQVPLSLEFVAVGGAKVDSSLIKFARHFRLPVFQGYGLSECASVVSICIAKDEPLNSVGKVLPHVNVKLEKGELIVSGNCFLGYLNQPDTWYPETVNTGDIVSTKNDYLFIHGRSKNIIITSFGRNISPEWLESKLASVGLFSQTIVIGEARPYLCALLVPIHKKVTQHDIHSSIQSINYDLPDYAKIGAHIVLAEPFTPKNGLLTENGKLKRSAIEIHYHHLIEQQYLQHSNLAV